MRSGNLRHRIQFMAIVDIQDEAGSVIPIETTLCEAMSEIKPVSGGERFMSNKVFTDATSQIRCRYVNGITPKHKIIFGIRKFDILNVQNKDERNVELLIIVKELF